jgi:hypothetical protein
MMTHRVLRRGYGICWNVQVSELQAVRRRTARIYRDAFEDIKCAQDMSKFIFRKVSWPNANPTHCDNKSTDIPDLKRANASD